MNMANCVREKVFRCWNDCEMSGCSGHTAKLEFQSTSNAYHFNFGMRDYYFNQSEMQVMIDLIKQLDRADTVKF